MPNRILILSLVAAVAGVRLVKRRKSRRKSDSFALSIPPATTPEAETKLTPRWSVSLQSELIMMAVSLVVATLVVWTAEWLMNEGELMRDPRFYEALPAMAASLFVTLLALCAFAAIGFRGDTASRAAPQPTIHSAAQIPDFSGMWIKVRLKRSGIQSSAFQDNARSTKPDAVMDIMHIGPLLRTAIHLMRGLQIHQDATTFETSVTSVVPLLKVSPSRSLRDEPASQVSERYSLNGTPSQYPRRDLRRGRHRGYVTWNDEEQKLSLWLEWDEPYSGKGLDEFQLLSSTELRVRSTCWTRGSHANYETIYVK